MFIFINHQNGESYELNYFNYLSKYNPVMFIIYIVYEHIL